jgi:hypothetical protein
MTYSEKPKKLVHAQSEQTLTTMIRPFTVVGEIRISEAPNEDGEQEGEDDAGPGGKQMNQSFSSYQTSLCSRRTNSEVVLDDEFTQILKKKEYTARAVNKFFKYVATRKMNESHCHNCG